MVQPINGTQPQCRRQQWQAPSRYAKPRAILGRPKVIGATVAAGVGALALLVAGRFQVAPRPISLPGEAVLVPVTVPMTVQPGDTLWSLAKRYGDPKAYQLDRVDALAAANGVHGDARLVPGQRLLVPVNNPVEIAQLRQNVAQNSR